MDISLLSLLYAVQNSSKSVPFNTNSGLHVVQKAGICFFQLAFLSSYCLAHPSFQVAKRVVEE